MDTYSRALAVTPSDTVDIASKFVSDALWVAGTGNLVIVFEDGKEMTLTAIAANSLLPFRVKRVKATGTTATNISALKR